jgi:peptide/nickel transport system substrate-binding protein
MLMGKSQQKFRQNPRKTWYDQVNDVTTNGDYEASFNLKRLQPSLLALLASGYTPVYPCHVSPAEMRTHPIGTGPFKFVEFKANESIKLTRNENYWKKGLPYLDGIEFTIIPNRSTAILAFIAGKFDMTYPTELTIPLLKDIKTQAPNAVCVVAPTNISANIIVNSSAPPFDNIDVRRALALALDRKAFIQILFEGQADIGGTMLPAPDGLWAMPNDMMEKIPGYGPDINANREEAKKLMQKAGYGPDKHLAIKVSTRNIPNYRDPAVILIDQLKSIYIDAELDVVDTAQWFPKVARKDYGLGLNLTGNAVDDPDQSFYENYSCGSERNYTNYCNKDIEKLFGEQSQETDLDKRKKMVWDIDRKLQEDVARPIIFHSRQGTCWQPYVKGVTIMVNSSFNGYRYEDVWLNK